MIEFSKLEYAQGKYIDWDFPSSYCPAVSTKEEMETAIHWFIDLENLMHDCNPRGCWRN